MCVCVCASVCVWCVCVCVCVVCVRVCVSCLMTDWYRVTANTALHAAHDASTAKQAHDSGKWPVTAACHRAIIARYGE